MSFRRGLRRPLPAKLAQTADNAKQDAKFLSVARQFGVPPAASVYGRRRVPGCRLVAVSQLPFGRTPIAIHPYSNWCTVSKCCRKPSFLRSLEDVPIMTHPLDSNCQMRIMHRLHFLIHTLSGVKVCFVQFFCFHGVIPMYKIVALFSGIAIY